MKPDELVIGNRYETGTRRDGDFFPVIYEGTKDEGKVFLFRRFGVWADEGDPPQEFLVDELEKLRPLLGQKYFVVKVIRSRMVTEGVKIGNYADTEEDARRQALDDAQNFEPLQKEWREVEGGAVEYDIEYADEILPENWF
jgi:hypothetical protein